MSGGSLHPYSGHDQSPLNPPTALAAELMPSGGEQLEEEGASSPAAPSVCFLLHRKLCSERPQRKYYSSTVTCTSQCFTERLLYCVHHHRPQPESKGLAGGFSQSLTVVRIDTAFVLETLFSLKYGDDVCFRSHAHARAEETEIRSVNRNMTNIAPCRLLSVLHNMNLLF